MIRKRTSRLGQDSLVFRWPRIEGNPIAVSSDTRITKLDGSEILTGVPNADGDYATVADNTLSRRMIQGMGA